MVKSRITTYVIGTIMIVLCLMVFATVSTYAETSGDYEYELNEDGTSVTITKYTESAENVINLEIPSEIDGYSVTRIGSKAFKDCKKMTSVVIPGSVKELENSAFNNCTRLYRVTISEGMSTIDFNAFFDCTIFRRIDLPVSIERIIPLENNRFYELDLDYIYYAGDKSQWRNIVVDGSNIESFSSETTVCYPASAPDYRPGKAEKCHSVERKLLDEYAAIDDILKEQGNPDADGKSYRLSTDQKLELKDAAESVIQDCSTDYEKIMAICEYVSHRIYYDYPAYIFGESTYLNAYKVWQKKRTICDGYARLSEFLLDLVGIPCLYIEASGDGDDLHAFNAAYDSQQQRWVYFDSTWCSGNRYLTDEEGEHWRGSIELDMDYFDMSIKYISKQGSHLMLNILNKLNVSDEDYYYNVYNYYYAPEEYIMAVFKPKNRNEQDVKIKQEISGLPVAMIDSNAFKNCTAMQSVSIPETVKNISWDAFYGCKNLKTVNYSGTMKEWKKISMRSGNECLNRCIINCTDGTIRKNPMDVYPNYGAPHASYKTVKYKKLKSKAVTVKVITVEYAKGKVKYKKVSGSANFKVNSKTGKITIKKKTRKGNYKIKVKVTASGDADYDPSTKTITVKFKIK